jgi:putative isomerase
LSVQYGIGGILILILCSATPIAAASSPPGQQFVFRSAGWNTWKMSRPNAFIYMPFGGGVELTVYDPQAGHLLAAPSLADVRFGAHAPDGSYVWARYKQGSLSYELEVASRGEDLVAHIRPLNQTHYVAVADFSFSFGRTGRVRRQGKGAVMESRGWRFLASSPNSEKPEPQLGTDHIMSWDLAGERWLSIGPERKVKSEEDCRRLVAQVKEDYERARVRSDGFLADTAQAALDLVSWNMVWNPRADAPVTTVAREWPADSGILWGGYLQGGWDSVFQALIADLQSPEMAEASLVGQLSDITPAGFVPNLGSGWGRTEDRSQLPLMSYALLQMYKTHGRRDLLVQAFPRLLRWHQWWFTVRDGNNNGLLEWGSTPVDSDGVHDFWRNMIDAFRPWIRNKYGTDPAWLNASNMAGTKQAATFESGVDDHPMWLDVTYSAQTHTMELDDVGLNSIFALDAWALAEIAHIIERPQEEQALRSEYQQMRKRVNDLLWSEKDGIYLNRHWDGHFDQHISPSNFYPLLSGLATDDQATRMVQEYLLNPNKFWGAYVIPGSPRDDPAFGKDGRNPQTELRAMASTNYLVYEGLKRYGRDEVAAEFAAKSELLFLREWQAKGHIHETYNANTAEGDDSLSSQYYSWGGLLPLIQVEELIDVEPWGEGIRVGSLGDRSASVANVPILADSYDVSVGPGLRVLRNGKLLLQADGPIVLRNLRWEKERVRFNPTVKQNVRITLYGFAEGEKVGLVSPEARTLIADDEHVVIEVGPTVKTVELSLQHVAGQQ